jgi:hypothetical protein
MRALQSVMNLELFYGCSPLLWLLSSIWCFLLAAIVKPFPTIKASYGVGLSTLVSTQNLEYLGIPSCHDLSGVEDRTRIYATAIIAPMIVLSWFRGVTIDGIWIDE